MSACATCITTALQECNNEGAAKMSPYPNWSVSMQPLIDTSDYVDVAGARIKDSLGAHGRNNTVLWVMQRATAPVIMPLQWEHSCTLAGRISFNLQGRSSFKQ